ncbi:general secretion pathway protein F [Parasphingorhabdus marina DSM 22363]|uniref:General secretion pathway protein F n=1 Tax=Parasphingorhabdus marina DSM 22363 TaxID=1123272 RepID=A0A1N6HLV4_9SPHN|nr:type II secretion system F family protein [Parasphingorhabdus marina]SIO20716.1 general secretion pathway protein F [Parasphingorhabdus marina DSM 22363]
MTDYRCLTVDAAGKKQWRKIAAASEHDCVELMLADGLTPLQVTSGSMTLAERLNQPVQFSFGPGLGEQALMLNQLALLVRSGLPVDRSLDLLRDQAPKARQKHMLHAILDKVKQGEGLARALEVARIFPGYVVGVVRSAERSGKLGEALTSVAARMTKATETRRKLATALTYPAAVLIATIAALVIVLTSVVPQFEPVFAGNEDRLPGITLLVLSFSAFVRSYGLFLLGGMLLVVTFFWILLRSEEGEQLMSRLAHYLPGIKLRDQYLAGQFTGLLATLIANGLTVVKALPLAKNTLSSRRWKSDLEDVERQIREGIRLSYALASTSVFPETASRLIEVGERTGKLGETCAHASEIMSQAASARIERIVSLVNPIAIILLGGLVAMLVAGVMLGIFALGDIAG